jgi:hypothetical protein
MNDLHPSTPDCFSPELTQRISDNLYKGDRLLDTVSEIIKPRLCFSIGNPSELGDYVEVDKLEFAEFLMAWPRYTKLNYSDADVWVVKWAGEEKWIALMYWRTNPKRYYIKPD